MSKRIEIDKLMNTTFYKELLQVSIELHKKEYPNKTDEELTVLAKVSMREQIEISRKKNNR